jgi:hypothetical protein
MKKLALTKIDHGLLILANVLVCPADLSVIAVSGMAVFGTSITLFINARRQKA